MNISNIHIDGPDACEFLQGQLSNDLRRLETEAEILAAWCNPKGRVIWFGTVSASQSGYILSALADTAEDIVKRLTVFRFRAKVELTIRDSDVSIDPGELIKSGHPVIGAAQSEAFTPHMLNLDLLDAISLDKGCYTGQEIVARTHYKGATKRRTLRFSTNGPVQIGDKVTRDGRAIGEVLNTAGNEFLAVVSVDKCGEDVRINGETATSQPMPYPI